MPRVDSAKYKYQVFVSHASEDCEPFVDRLVDELKAIGITAWYDRERMSSGDATITKMNDGMRSSRCSVIIASHEYFGKRFTQVEADTLLYLETNDRARRVIPVLYGISQADLIDYNPILSTRLYIDSATKSLPEIVTYISHAVLRPPELAELEIKPGFRPVKEPEVSPFTPGVHNDPFDVLPESKEVLTARPELKIIWYTPGILEDHLAIMWEIENAGAGRAVDVNVFIPGLLVYSIDKIEPGAKHSTKIRYDDRYAYYEFMKPPVQAITEASDVFGNTYRQYANVSHSPKWHGNDAQYKTTQLGYPYPVSQRIVQLDEPGHDRFQRSESLHWDLGDD